MPRILSHDDELDLDVRRGHIHRQQALAFGRLPRSSAASPAIPVPGPDSHQAVVKVWGAAPGGTSRHLRYLTHGKGTDGTDTTLFNAQGYILDATAFVQQANQDPHQYRLVISVADPVDLSLRRYVQAWMGQVSRDLRQPVAYLAAVHRDTTHLHVHVVLRGRDQEGHQLTLPQRYLTHGLRYRAMGLATAWLGPVAIQARAVHLTRARALDTAMNTETRATKKEDAMDDDPFGRPVSLPERIANVEQSLRELHESPRHAGRTAAIRSTEALLRELRQEAPMDDQDHDQRPREIDAQPTVPEALADARQPTLLERLEALLQRVQQTNAKDLGMDV
jgi:hypothetical protein